jgi:hypothetical protein
MIDEPAQSKKGPLPTRNSESHSRLRPGFQEHQDPAHRNTASHGGPTWALCYRSGVCIAAMHMHDPERPAPGSAGVISVVGVSVDELRRGSIKETSCAVAPSSFVAGFLLGSSIARGGGFTRCTCHSASSMCDSRQEHCPLGLNSPRV